MNGDDSGYIPEKFWLGTVRNPSPGDWRRAGVVVCNNAPEDAADLLAMLGITAESTRG